MTAEDYVNAKFELAYKCHYMEDSIFKEIECKGETLLLNICYISEKYPVLAFIICLIGGSFLLNLFKQSDD